MKDYTNKVSDPFEDLTWEEAVALPEKLNAENYKGFSDWYLPDINELKNCFDHVESKPVPGWENTKGYLWSSSSYVASANKAWLVGLGYGGIAFDDKGNYYSVRCVRP